jgi:KDO2-lipid IV(A) lauroyltransferase
MIWPKKVYLLLCSIFVKTTPRWWQIWQNRLVSRLLFWFWGSARRKVQRNLAGVLQRPADDPEVVRVAARTFENYGLYLLDYVQLGCLNRQTLPGKVAEELGTEHLDQALQDGRGAILMTPHLGNWELGGLTIAARGTPVHVLTVVDRDNQVQAYRDEVRGLHGIQTIHLHFEDYRTILDMVHLLKENRVLAMLGDRWVGGKKSAVRFFGRRIWFPSGAAALAQATGAPLIPVFVVKRPDGRYKAWMEPPIRVSRQHGHSNQTIIEEKTQELASVFERMIRAYPDQWYHFFDYWSRYDCERSAA